MWQIKKPWTLNLGLEIYTGEEAIGAEVGIAAAPCPAISSRGFPAGLVPGSGCPESISVLGSNLLSGYILDHKIRSIQNNFYWGFRWTAGKFRCTNRYCENNTEEWPSSLFQRTVDWNVVWVHNLRNAGHGHQGGCGVSGRGKQVSNTRWYCRNKLEVFLEQ